MSGCGWELGLLSGVGMSPHTLSQERPPCRTGEGVSGAASAGKGLPASFVGPRAVTAHLCARPARLTGPAVAMGLQAVVCRPLCQTLMDFV